ncbi:MAG: type I-E CRISPR-associated protein Cas7/Cse4/CasC [Thermoguttaceae bacterium]|nr:type I-E CRISPR-associated protein Cas7/Cse4/CasC [Thermoguttaceae bacterium]
MKLIELHLLQSFPATCLNRDDVGAPKSVIFGGVPRARVSSQCWKRAIRQNAFTNAPEYFAGQRGHYHSEALKEKLIELGVDAETAQNAAVEVMRALAGDKANKKEETSSGALLYFSPDELEKIAKAIRDLQDKKKPLTTKNKEGKKIANKDIAKTIKKDISRDFADIAILGRMVASEPTLMLEGAGMFSHALSTHEAANEVDFFSAVDDTKPTDNAGAGHIGTLEMNSACYYRYIGLNIDLLFDADHLEKLNDKDKKTILSIFLHAVIESVPGARKNSMFGFTLPQYALGFVRKGQPLSLVNAFETPVHADKKVGGYVAPSIKSLNEHWETLKKQYGLGESDKLLGEFVIGDDMPINQWIDKLVSTALEE